MGVIKVIVLKVASWQSYSNNIKINYVKEV